MARFYFHLDDSLGRAFDEEGQELSDAAAARRAAVANIRSILKSDVDEGFIDLSGRIEIADEAGALVAVIHFREAVEVRSGGEHE